MLDGLKSKQVVYVPIARIDRVHALMESFDDADRMVRSYSLGMRQRLGLSLLQQRKSHWVCCALFERCDASVVATDLLV
jgi:hypothetical protein